MLNDEIIRSRLPGTKQQKLHDTLRADSSEADQTSQTRKEYGQNGRSPRTFGLDSALVYVFRSDRKWNVELELGDGTGRDVSYEPMSCSELPLG